MQFDKKKAEENVRMVISNRIKTQKVFSSGWEGRIRNTLSPSVLNQIHVHRFNLNTLIKEEAEKYLNATK